MKRTFSIVMLMVFILIFHGIAFSEKERIVVGIYPNPPLVDVSESGEPTGFFITLMNHIAEKEALDLEYKFDYFNESLKKIERNQLDLMLAVAYTDERAEKYLYNNETVYTNWGQVYINKRQNIECYLDLEGKKIGVEKGDIHYVGDNGIRKTLEDFNVNSTYVEYNGRREMLNDLEKGKLDAAVVSRLFREHYEAHYDIRITSLQFNPIKLKFIASDEENQWLLDLIDKNMIGLKEDESSIYYRQLNNMLSLDAKMTMPHNIKAAIALLLTSLMVAMVTIAIYRKTIRKQNSSIKTQNQLLKQLIEDVTEINGITKMDELFEGLVRQLKKLIKADALEIVSVVKNDETYYLDEVRFIEGRYKEYAQKPVNETPFKSSFEKIILTVDESDMSVHFIDNKVLVPYESSYQKRGYLYIETEPEIMEMELFELYMANILMNLKMINYNILRNREQTRLFIALGELIEKRDKSVANHVKRVSEASRILGCCCGYGEDEVNNLIIASSVHDIGKIYVPDEILNYPGRLSSDQYEVIKTHATDDFRILDELSNQLSEMVHDVIRYHHENWDGTGYPEGLKGEEIPMAARIVSVVDVFEALTHERPYKKAWSFEQAEKYIQKNSGVKFDPVVVECFLEKSREIHEVFMQYPDK